MCSWGTLLAPKTNDLSRLCSVALMALRFPQMRHVSGIDGKLTPCKGPCHSMVASAVLITFQVDLMGTPVAGWNVAFALAGRGEQTTTLPAKMTHTLAAPVWSTVSMGHIACSRSDAELSLAQCRAFSLMASQPAAHHCKNECFCLLW